MRLTGRSSYIEEFGQTAVDFAEAGRQIPLAFNLALQDILARYRGSLLGPWWITLTTMTLVVGIGINYAALFHQEIKELLPYVAMGLVFWGYIAAVIAEGGEAFVVGSAMIKQSCLPLPLFILRTLIRNVIILAHQIVIVAGVMIYFSIFPGLGLLWAFVGLFVVTINLTWIGLMLSMVSARFRDMPQIVAAILQLLFFLSPIIWHPNAKLENNPLVNANPFYLAVQSIRDPILHGTERIEVFTWLIPSAIIGWLATIIVYNQTRRRVVHYL